MPEPVPRAELLRSLGRLVRGLSALFWGLPLALVVCFHTAKAEALRSFGIVPPLAVTGLLVYGLWQLGDFQKQERVWRNALDCARILALIDFGLSPFLYWWNQVPSNSFYLAMVLLEVVSGLAFLGSLNWVLQRLAAMLPDEALRLETRQFTALNFNLLLVTASCGLLYALYLTGQPDHGAHRVQRLSPWMATVTQVIDRGSNWFLVLLVLCPVALTMALLWKTKEVILDSIFGAQD
ncbi:conserved membrane hypothetical protein [Verrucomicrobia bacterium]|nr:conserved membrane hypothetical protein [Verrucomicrobiota bacterium]